MRLTGLKRVENGLKSMQGLKLSFLKVVLIRQAQAARLSLCVS